MPEWLARFVPQGWSGGEVALAGVVITVVTALVSVAVCAVVAVRLPADYFACPDPPRFCATKPGYVRWPLIVFKNLFGVFLVLLGIVLSFPGVPGQGILTILMGAMLLDFPGKRRAERWLLRRRGVLAGLNKVRARFGRPPLVVAATPQAAENP